MLSIVLSLLMFFSPFITTAAELGDFVTKCARMRAYSR
jgi:hypothetical protein